MNKDGRRVCYPLVGRRKKTKNKVKNILNLWYFFLFDFLHWNHLPAQFWYHWSDSATPAGKSWSRKLNAHINDGLSRPFNLKSTHFWLRLVVHLCPESTAAIVDSSTEVCFRLCRVQAGSRATPRSTCSLSTQHSVKMRRFITANKSGTCTFFVFFFCFFNQRPNQSKFCRVSWSNFPPNLHRVQKPPTLQNNRTNKRAFPSQWPIFNYFSLSAIFFSNTSLAPKVKILFLLTEPQINDPFEVEKQAQLNLETVPIVLSQHTHPIWPSDSSAQVASRCSRKQPSVIADFPSN